MMQLGTFNAIVFPSLTQVSAIFESIVGAG